VAAEVALGNDMTMTDVEIADILVRTKTIASVGQSSDPSRPSYGVMGYLRVHGYRVIPVNPRETEVFGERAYPDLRSVPVPVDVVQVFRAPEHAPAVVEEAIAIGAKVVWMQDGAGNEAAASRAREAGLLAVTDDCMMRRHRALLTEH
jgi:predicted CoA-binding protein